MSTRTQSRISIFVPSLALALLLLVLPPVLASGVAATSGSSSVMAVRAQNVGWMNAEQASSLDLSFAVLVPTAIPAPFSGSPSISGGGGYYSLYWVNYGGAPTFLHITGEVGGALPAGSPADLNVQLSINASVQGYEAIHDVTSIYDNVWWVAGGVLYTVSSNNMTGTDSLSLANSLIRFQPPVAQEPEPVPPTPAPPTAVPAPPTSAPSSSTQAQQDEPSATSANQSNEPEQATGEVGSAADQTGEDGFGEVAADDSPDGDVASAISGLTSTQAATSSDTEELLNALAGSVARSDGTAGPPLPSGGDGTGGTRQIAIP